MSNANLSDREWNTIFGFLIIQSSIYTGEESKCRRFVEAVLWMLRSGAQWRLLPEERGKWNSVFKRFDRWGKKGIWKDLHTYLSNDPDLESVMVDSTVVRAHACAAGAACKPGQKKGI